MDRMGSVTIVILAPGGMEMHCKKTLCCFGREMVIITKKEEVLCKNRNGCIHDVFKVTSSAFKLVSLSPPSSN